MSGLLFFLLFGIVAAGAIYLQTESRKNRALEVAQRLGLTVEGVDELVGVREGVGLRMYSRDHGGSSRTEWWTYTRCRLNDDLPEGMVVANQGFFGHMADLFGARDIQLGTALDPELRINGVDENGIRELLTDAEVHEAIRAILDAGGRIELSGSGLTVKVRGRHTDHAASRASEAIRLVHALTAAGRGAWETLAHAHGLAIDEAAAQISGTLRGVDVMIELLRGRSRTTRITALIARPLPGGTAVVHKDLGGGGERLGDPVLDGMVVARTSDAGALSDRVCQDEVRGALLEVVHGYPGSVLRSDRVELTAPGRLGRELKTAVNAAVELAAALS